MKPHAHLIIKSEACLVSYSPNVLNNTHQFFSSIRKKTQWRKDKIKLFGKDIPIPRFQAWYGDPGTSYQYSNIILAPLPWFDELLELKKLAEEYSGENFNSVLLNLYENGRDYSAWHSDDEKELGINPTILSISLGATRIFHLRHKKTNQNIKIELEDGSILLMKGATQHIYKHQLAKTAKIVGPRINLTFRKIRH